MNGQGSLYEPRHERTMPEITSLDRYQGAMVFSAVGDALGWPTEFLRQTANRQPPFKLPLHNFISWRKMVGGRWWGYSDEISPGDYSDDTQLTLAVARCISSAGDFEPEKFAYEEMPLWLHYQRGGGRSIKAAARSLIHVKAGWQGNFYKQGIVEYTQAGSNGAAMRNLPIALAKAANEKGLIRDSFFNAIITHGHPRAILGTILFGLAVRFLITQLRYSSTEMLQYLREGVDISVGIILEDEQIVSWIKDWERHRPNSSATFQQLLRETQIEIMKNLGAIGEHLSSPDEYYQLIGAVTPTTKGSAIATVSAALYLFLRQDESPESTIYHAVNMIGSDTDTIASVLGAMLGASFGLKAVPTHLVERIQDREYLLKTATRLHDIMTDRQGDQAASIQKLSRKEAFIRIMAWEIGLHEMFWDAVEVGGVVYHPTLGSGVITRKQSRKIVKAGYIAKLIHIQFDCGQSCVFHSRVKNERLSESLSEEIEKVLSK